MKDEAGRRVLLARNVLFFVAAMACAGRLAAQSNGVDVLQSFSGPPNGRNPAAPVIQGSDGNFYGVTGKGGISNHGTVFEMTPAGILTTLYAFTGGADGGAPKAGLIQGKDGNFYGTTSGGGDSNGDGTVFRITSEGVLTTLYTFTGAADGASPAAVLTQGSDGNFYGTAQYGGNSSGYGYGSVFKITPAGVLTTLYAFRGSDDGAFPNAGLTRGADGNFYGTSAGNYYDGNPGSAFRITPAGVFTTLYTFTGTSNGGGPGGLTQGADGNFYGTTAYGGYFHRYEDGSDGQGTVFKLTPAGVLTVLYAFRGGADGDGPNAGLTLGADGNFYGTTVLGGNGREGDGHGTVFKITPAGVLTAIYTFTGGPDGAKPEAGLTQGADGNLYGTTYGGGQDGLGIVFRLNLPPVVTLAATVPQAVLGSGDAGEFTLSLPAPQSADVVVAYTIKGSAINGIDYQLIKASAKIQAGKTSKVIEIVPQGDLEGASKKVVTLVLNPSDSYTVGTTGKVKVKILSAPGI